MKGAGKTEIEIPLETAKKTLNFQRIIPGQRAKKKPSYKLFVGFRKLGEFCSVCEARKHAKDCRLSGVFNLIGDRYRDSWYVSKIEVE